MKIVEPTYDWTPSVAPQYVTPEDAHWKVGSDIFHRTEFVIRDYTLEVIKEVAWLTAELRMKHDFGSA